ncbi:AAA family ATPase [Salirhabdus salicampi]|uniref:AAA family ATPase n=1 Tax=Salirhabdus salicampi TaxID=476102 RepID=UPI0020C2AFB8|nr:MoxR family ATPase [Salirhabdus salicampi]MCP8615297.1 MoxR family ATPase [Salirhabdus salicampi]
MSQQNLLAAGKNELKKVIIGQDHVIDLLYIALMVEGHVLLESSPGSGKTKLAKSFAQVTDGSFNRIQFTPDVLPSDVTGVNFFNPKTEQFELRMGPIQTNILLADEINRGTPRTQASLLEVMEERQVTIDGEQVSIRTPFLVIATQNPIESNQGTFPLPEAQLDRFLFKVKMGYPTLEEEKQILHTYRGQEGESKLATILTREDIHLLQKKTKSVKVAQAVEDYALHVVRFTRNHPDIELGISTRGALALIKASQALAVLKGRDYVTPEDVKGLVPYVFEHRLVLSMEATVRKNVEQVVQEVIKSVEVPVELSEG